MLSILDIGSAVDLERVLSSVLADADARLDVVSVQDPETGLDRLEAADFDCVVVGRDSPGPPVAESIREIEAAIPLVLVVGPDGETASMALDSGATDVFRTSPENDHTELLANRILTVVGDRAAGADSRVESLEQYQRIVEHLPVGVFRATIDGQFLDVNPAFVSLVGGDSPAEVMAVDVDDLYGGPETSATIRSLLGQSGPVQDEEIRLRRLDGEDRWISTTLQVVEGDDQQYVEGICRDVTDRKERERELRQKEERYRNLVENSPAPINLFDEAGTTVWGNDAVLELLGLDSLSALRGRSIFEFIHPDDHGVAEMELRDVIAENETAGPTNFRIVRADGETRHVQVKTTAGWYEGDRVGQAVVVDVTALRETEKRLRQNEQRYRTLVEMSPDPILVHTDGIVVYANDAMVDLVSGSDRSDVEGLHINRFLDPSEHVDASETASLVQRGEAEPTRYERTVRTLDGDRRYIETTSRPIAYEGSPSVLTVVKDVTDRYEYEQMLTTLHDRTREMTRANGRTAIAAVVVETAAELLQTDVAVAYEFDGDDTFVPLEWSASGGVIDDRPASQADDGPLWTALVDGDLHRVRGPAAADLLDGVDLASAVVLPVGTHGVLLAGSTDDGTLDSPHGQIAHLLMDNYEAALDRAGREATLLERDRQLQRKNEALEQLNRLNEIIREINQTLIRSTTRSEIETSVCERLAATEQYAFAWIGERSAPETAVTPVQWDGVGPEFVDQIEADGETTPLQRLVDTAYRTQSVQVAQGILDDSAWREQRSEVLSYGYRSVAAVPVVEDTSLDSVLVIHAEEGDIFDERERAVLAELGQTVGYALRNVERVDALLSGERTAVDLSIDDARLFTNRFARELGGTVEFEGAIRDDGAVRTFLRVEGVTAEAVETKLAAMESVRSVRPLSVEATSGLYQVRMAAPPLIDILQGLDARLRTLRASDGVSSLTIVVTGATSVRTVVDELRARYPGTELVARREQTDPVDTRETFRDRILDQLTDKQRDALQTAQYGGFYQWPRESTSEQLAATRDIAPSTFQYHLRAAERKLVAAVLDPL